MTTDRFVKGIEILRKYDDSQYPLNAEHDVFYFSCQRPLSSEDNMAVRALGWFRVNDDVVDGETVVTPEDEDGSTWQAFV